MIDANQPPEPIRDVSLVSRSLVHASVLLLLAAVISNFVSMHVLVRSNAELRHRIDVLSSALRRSYGWDACEPDCGSEFPKARKVETMDFGTPKKLLRIDEVFVFVAKDEEGEGVPAFVAGAYWMPLVCADEQRVDSLREAAKTIARQSGARITLCRFSVRDELEVIEP